MQARIQRQRQHRLTEIGKIKIGQITESANGKPIPQSLDYFRPTGEYAPHFFELYGGNPKCLEIVFPSDDAKECCFERYELRQGSKLFADGDGENFRVWDEKAKRYNDINVGGQKDFGKNLAASTGGKWSTILTLRFMLLKMRGVYGVWSLSTRGDASSIPQIVNTFDDVLSNAGRVHGIPFDLTVEKVTSQKPGSQSSFPVLKLIPNLSLDRQVMLKNLIESGREYKGVIDVERLEKEVKQIGAI